MKKPRMVEVSDIWCDECGRQLGEHAYNYSGYGKDFCSNLCITVYEQKHPEKRAELDRLIGLGSSGLDRIMKEEAQS